MPLPLLEMSREDRDSELQSLRDRVERLQDDLSHARAALTEERKRSAASARGLVRVKQQLEPLYNSLRALFGEIEDVGVSESAGPAINSRQGAVWESWKTKLGGGTAKVIDALLLHGEMNTTQLSIATGLHRTTIPALIFKLNKASLINKNGGKFSLKEL